MTTGTWVKISFLFVLISCCFGYTQDSLFDISIDSLKQKLIDDGFENITLIKNAENFIIQYENRIYRDELYAIGIILSCFSKYTTDSLKIALLPLKNRVPICTIHINLSDFLNYVEDKISENEFLSRIQLDNPQSLHIKAKSDSLYSVANNSFAKLDLFFYPGISIYLGNYDDRFKANIKINSLLCTSLWKGGSFFCEIAFPLYSDVTYQSYRYHDDIEFSKAAVNQLCWLPLNVMSSVSFGAFNPNRWGLGGEVNKLFLDRHLLVGYSLDWTGWFLYREHILNYSKINKLTSKAYIYYFWDYADIKVGLSYNKYLIGDEGPRFDFFRSFRETSLGFYFASTQIDKHGGLYIKFPLSRIKKSKNNFFRVSLPCYYEWEYRATNFVYTQSEPIQTGIAVFSGTKLYNFYNNLTTSYFKNNIEILKKAYIYKNRKKRRSESENFINSE